MKRKSFKLLLGVFATGFLTTPLFAIADDAGDRARERQISAQLQREYQERLQKYPYRQHTSGIAMVKEDAGVQKCLKWTVRAPINHPKRSPDIEHALYDIGVMGDILREHDGNIDKIPNKSYYNDLREKIARGSRAMGFCAVLPEPPPPPTQGK